MVDKVLSRAHISTVTYRYHCCSWAV